MKTFSVAEFQPIDSTVFLTAGFFKQEIEGEMILFGRIILNKKEATLAVNRPNRVIPVSIKNTATPRPNPVTGYISP